MFQQLETYKILTITLAQCIFKHHNRPLCCMICFFLRKFTILSLLQMLVLFFFIKLEDGEKDQFCLLFLALCLSASALNLCFIAILGIKKETNVNFNLDDHKPFLAYLQPFKTFNQATEIWLRPQSKVKKPFKEQSIMHTRSSSIIQNAHACFLYLKQSGPNNILGNSWLLQNLEFASTNFLHATWDLGADPRIGCVFYTWIQLKKSSTEKKSFYLHSLPQPYSSWEPYSSMYFNSQNSPISLV